MAVKALDAVDKDLQALQTGLGTAFLFVEGRD
jgi:hypothetical protein